MTLWLLLTFAALAECRFLKRDLPSCPELCSCSVPQEVVCSLFRLAAFPSHGLSPDTTRLSIQSTGLGAVTARHLSAVPLLNHLQLYHNNLSGLPSDLLRAVPHLNTLDLTGNRLVGLPPDVFGLASLRSLVLKNNRIERVDVEWFGVNGSLTWLDLSGNRLTDVPSALHLGMPRLLILDLSHNDLRLLRPEALEHLRHLETLNLAGNKLISLSPATFAHNLQLTQLFLQENLIRDVPAGLVQGLPRLELLLLNQNRLKNLPSGFLGERKSTFRVLLTGNPWVCDQEIDFLKEWVTLHPHNVLFQEEVTCAAPEALRQRRVVSLADGELKSDGMTD